MHFIYVIVFLHFVSCTLMKAVELQPKRWCLFMRSY